MSYTQDEIMAMTVEQLRVAIAEAKGWTDIGYYDGPDLKDWLGITPDNHRLPKYQLRIPDWSRDIAAVWELVEEAENNDVWFRINNVIPGSDPIVYEVRLWDGNEYYACEDTIPLAISRAYLLWKMEAK